MSTRYYIHGDEHDSDFYSYYCHFCDAFVNQNHLNGHAEYRNNQDCYNRTLEIYKKLKKKYPNKYSRPKSAINLFAHLSPILNLKKGRFYRWILRQSDRDDPVGDFSRDYLRTLDDPDIYLKTRFKGDIKKISLYNLYQNIPWMMRREEVVLALIELWKEWLVYNQIGLKFNEPEKGYVYFFKVRGENAFKIGKTKKDPNFRKSQIEANEKIRLYIFNWMYINNYSIIESELKSSFKQFQIQREWYEFEFYGMGKNKVEYCLEIKIAIELYSKTDPTSKLFKKFYVG